MNAIMTDPAKINLSAIPFAEVQNLAETFIAAVKRFYDDPKNEAEFQMWKKYKEANHAGN